MRLLAVLCSFSGGLPTGAPTSPAIANQVLSRADRSIRKAAEAKNVCYTRYADDLTFSGDGHEPVEILPFVEEVVGQLGYQLDPKKTNFFRKGQAPVCDRIGGQSETQPGKALEAQAACGSPPLCSSKTDGMAWKADEPDPASGKARLSCPNPARRGETIENTDSGMRQR